MIKKLAPYTKGYRLLMLFAIACSPERRCWS